MLFIDDEAWEHGISEDTVFGLGEVIGSPVGCQLSLAVGVSV